MLSPFGALKFFVNFIHLHLVKCRGMWYDLTIERAPSLFHERSEHYEVYLRMQESSPE